MRSNETKDLIVIIVRELKTEAAKDKYKKSSIAVMVESQSRNQSHHNEFSHNQKKEGASKDGKQKKEIQ